MLAAAWSADGSLLAAAAGDTATLWEPTSNALLATLPTPLPAVGSPLRHLAFVAGTPFLVSALWPALAASLSCLFAVCEEASACAWGHAVLHLTAFLGSP